MSEEQNIKQLPEGWKWVKLGEVCDKMTNGANAKQFEDKIGFPISRIETIWNEKIDLDRVKYIKENDEAFIAKYSLQRNDILFSHINSDVHLGKTAIFKNQPKVLIHGINLLLIRLNKDVIADFFNYQFKYKRKSGEFISIAQKSVNQSSINQSKLKNVDFVLPPLPTQTAIVAKIEELFSELDKGIEQLKTAQQQLKTYRQAVLKWAFEGRLTKGLNHDSYDLHDDPDLMLAAEPAAGYKTKNNQDNQNNHINQSSDNGKLPEGWRYELLKEICHITGGVTKGRNFKGKETIYLPYLRVANVQDGYLALSEIKIIEVLPSDKEKYKLLQGDILYTEGGDKDKLGRGTIWKNEIENCIHQNHIFRARPISKDINSKYIAYYSQTKSAKNYFFKHGKQTTNLASINLTILSNLPLPLCSLEEQTQIVQQIESRLSVADKMEESITQSLQQAEALRQSILKQAFEGRLTTATVSSPIFKPKNQYFFNCQILGYIIRASKKKNIGHGEMTLAKYAYLAVKIFGIPLSYIFQQWHLGPYPPEIKKAVNNKQFFLHTKNGIELADEMKLLKYDNPYFKQTEQAVDELIAIFENYDEKDRSHKTELLATICKVIEDTASTDFSTIREAMRNWKIVLKSSPYKNKAEKFNEEETRQCLSFIISKKWDTKLKQ